MDTEGKFFHGERNETPCKRPLLGTENNCDFVFTMFSKICEIFNLSDVQYQFSTFCVFAILICILTVELSFWIYQRAVA